MKLLVFAHRGEAQHFLKSMNFDAFKSETSNIEGFYQCKETNTYLLITGEGIQLAINKLSFVLGLLQIKLTENDKIEVINLGIAGQLTNEFESKDHTAIYQARCLFHYSNEMQFKSFPLIETQVERQDIKLVDLISSDQRVLDLKTRNHLANFGHLVDREAWGLGFVCQQLNINLAVYKLVTDDADNEEICQRVKEETQKYSIRLFDFYQNLIGSKNSISRSALTACDPNSFNDLDLYLTKSHQRKLKQLASIAETKNLSSLIAKYNLQKPLEDILSTKKKEKLKSSLIIKLIEDAQNPFNKQMEQSLFETLKEVNGSGWKYHYDHTYENEYLDLKCQIQSEAQFEKLKSSLDSFSYNEFKNIIQGNHFES